MASWLSGSLSEVVLILINFQCILFCFYFRLIKFVVLCIGLKFKTATFLHVYKQLFLRASHDQTAAVSSEPFVRTLRMTRYVYAERIFIWHVFMTYENVSTLVCMYTCTTITNS